MSYKIEENITKNQEADITKGHVSITSHVWKLLIKSRDKMNFFTTKWTFPSVCNGGSSEEVTGRDAEFY